MSHDRDSRCLVSNGFLFRRCSSCSSGASFLALLPHEEELCLAGLLRALLGGSMIRFKESKGQGTVQQLCPSWLNAP